MITLINLITLVDEWKQWAIQNHRNRTWMRPSAPFSSALLLCDKGFIVINPQRCLSSLTNVRSSVFEVKNHATKYTIVNVNESTATIHWKRNRASAAAAAEKKKKNCRRNAHLFPLNTKQKLWSDRNLNKATIWSSFNDTFLCRYFCMLFGFSKRILMDAFLLIIQIQDVVFFDYSLTFSPFI